jgi:hypothetical protein
MVDGLAAMIEAAKEKGYLTGLVPGLIKKGISMLQYIDDTVLLVENTFFKYSTHEVSSILL